MSIDRTWKEEVLRKAIVWGSAATNYHDVRSWAGISENHFLEMMEQAEFRNALDAILAYNNTIIFPEKPEQDEIVELRDISDATAMIEIRGVLKKAEENGDSLSLGDVAGVLFLDLGQVARAFNKLMDENEKTVQKSRGYIECLTTY